MTDTDTIARLTAELVEVRRENTMLHEANEGLGAACWTAQRELAAALAGAVEVRELEWVQNPVAEIWRCDTMIGTYKVFGVGPAPTWDFDGLSDIALARCAESVEAAKAAAQADYRARILAALHPSPDALQAVTAAAFEAAAKICVPDERSSHHDQSEFESGCRHGLWGAHMRITRMTPADALAAQTRRDAQMRAEEWLAGFEAGKSFMLTSDPEKREAILSRALLALAAQTEEASHV